MFPVPVADTGVPSGGNTYELGLAFSDFNADGIVDVAVANGDDTVSVMNGRGARRFGAPAIYTTGQHAIRLVAGDLDNDGDPDLVVAALDYVARSGSLRVLVNDGTGSFMVGTAYDIATGELALGDLDGDGLLDMVVGDGGNVSVLYNTGGATFGPRVDYPTGGQAGYGTWQPLIADLDGDGALDLVTSANAQQIAVLLRRGSGYATTLFLVSSDQDATAGLALGDFDRDGDIDVVVDSQAVPSDTIRVMANDGAGGFTPLAPTTLPLNVRLVAAGDLDGDSTPDLVVHSSTDYHFGVLRSDGTGAFTSAWTQSENRVIDFTTLVDLDGDGHLDLAYSSTSGVASVGEVFSLAGRGDGTFVVPLALSKAGGAFVPARMGDVDNDGRPDVVRGGNRSVEVLRNLGDNFANPVKYWTIGTVMSLALGDFDGDGRLDVVVGSSSNGAWSIEIMLGTPAGFVSAGSYPTDAEPYNIAVGDVDRDGRPDIIAGCAGYLDPTHSRPSEPGGLDVFHNGAGGTFSLATRIDGDYGHVSLADVDRDGRVDLFADLRDGAGFLIGAKLLPGNGDGTFGSPIALPGSTYSLVDMNRDGIPDEVWIGDGNALAIGVGRGDGTYADPIAGPAGVLAVADVDGDCVPDVITRPGLVLGLWHGNGDGTFAAVAQFEAQQTVSAQVGDLDGDGLPDLLIGPDQVQYQRCAL